MIKVRAMDARCPTCNANAWNEDGSCEVCRCRERNERLTTKLLRVRDALKYQANSGGGLVAEIDAALKEGE